MEHKSLLRLALPVALSVAALYGQAKAGVSRYDLVRDWSSSSPYLSKVAICSDGSSYGSDGAGALIRIDANGTRTHEQLGIAAIETVRAVACDSQGRFIGGISRNSSIVVFAPQERGDFSAVSAVRPKPILSPMSILPLPGLGYAVLGVGPDHQHPIHVVSETGVIGTDFGSFPAGIGETIESKVRLRGSLVWDSARQSILFFPASSYELSEFTPTGQLIGTFSRAGSGFHTANFDQSSGNPLPNDQVIRAVELAGGDLLVEVVTYEVVGPMTVKSDAYLEIVDRHMQEKSTKMDPTGFGMLQGSDAKGNLYFTLPSETDGTTLIKAHFVPRQ